MAQNPDDPKAPDKKPKSESNEGADTSKIKNRLDGITSRTSKLAGPDSPVFKRGIIVAPLITVKSIRQDNKDRNDETNANMAKMEQGRTIQDSKNFKLAEPDSPVFKHGFIVGPLITIKNAPKAPAQNKGGGSPHGYPWIDPPDPDEPQQARTDAPTDIPSDSTPDVPIKTETNKNTKD